MLRRAYALRDKDDVRRLYHDWADRYEDDLVDMGFVGYRVAAAKLGQLVPSSARVLDAGCGTGLVGAELAAAGFTAIDGIDLSTDMLRIAGEKQLADKHSASTESRSTESGSTVSASPQSASNDSGRVYDKLMPADLTARLPLSDNEYDAVICVGTFTHGHVGPAGLTELIRVTAPGGPIVFTVIDGSWEADGFADAVSALATSGQVSDYHRESAPYHTHEGLTCQLVTLTK